MPDQPDDWTVIIPIENLKITTHGLKVGPVRLVRYTNSRVSRLIGIARKLIAQNPHYSTCMISAPTWCTVVRCR